MKKNIALVYGGYSKENVVSNNTYKEIERNIDKNLFNVYPIEIKIKGWYYKDAGKNKLVDKNDFTIQINNNKIVFDLVFIAIHGTPGENGILQGYFDMIKIPYTSCNSFTSSLTFNKAATKMIVKNYNITTANFVLLRKNQEYNINNISKYIKFPMFVKPNNGGSSFGISKVKKISELEDAIINAFNEDNEIIIEEFIEGREFTCGIYCSKNNSLVFPITEICTKNEFFDFDAKYQADLTDEITPAKISMETTKKIQALSLYIYNTLNCSGLVRIDYLLKNKTPYFMEVNTIPGMSKESIVPKQIRSHGMNLTDFYTMVINDAIADK